jgi:hypothetical protein
MRDPAANPRTVMWLRVLPAAIRKMESRNYEPAIMVMAVNGVSAGLRIGLTGELFCYQDMRSQKSRFSVLRYDNPQHMAKTFECVMKPRTIGDSLLKGAISAILKTRKPGL